MSDNNMGENPEEVVVKNDDGVLALGILVGAAVLVLIFFLYLWRVKKIFSSKDERFAKQMHQLLSFSFLLNLFTDGNKHHLPSPHLRNALCIWKQNKSWTRRKFQR